MTESFWPLTLKDWVSVIQGLAVAAAAIAGFLGLKAWHRQLRRAEIAEQAKEKP